MLDPSDGSIIGPPLVLVEGFMCAASSTIWGDFRSELDKGDEEWLRLRQEGKNTIQKSDAIYQAGHSQLNKRCRRRIIFASVGPVSSLHDRACELFYSLRGGRVDYGKDHSKTHGHGQFGRDFGPGRYPQWGEVDPSSGKINTAHFVGHSLGGPTIYKLQQLLRKGFFDHALERSETSVLSAVDVQSRASAMVISILAVSSPFRGTPIVHLLGEEPLPHPVVRRFSAGDLLAKGAHLVTYLNNSWTPRMIKSHLPDLLADSWPFAMPTPSSLMPVFMQNIAALLRQWIKSDWAEGRDCAPWDCTVFERTKMEDDKSWGAIDGSSSSMYHGTWYCCIAAHMTETDASGSQSARLMFRGSVLPSLLSFGANWMAKFRYECIPEAPPSTRRSSEDEEVERAYLEVRPTAKLDSGYTSSTCCAGSRDESTLCSSTMTPSKSTGIDQASGDSLTARVIEGVTARLRRNPRANRTDEDTAGQMSSLGLLSSCGPAAWSANDGIVPLASQFHPRDCEEGLCTHSLGLMRDSNCSIVGSFGNGGQRRKTPEPRQRHAQPNHYYTYTLPNTTHATLCPLWIGSDEQRQFWRFVAGWLRDVELAGGVI